MLRGMVFGVPKCSGSVWGLPGMGGRAGPDGTERTRDEEEKNRGVGLNRYSD